MKNLWHKDFIFNKFIPFIVFLIAVYFPVFLHLSTDALGMWDEGFYALRAYNLAYYNEYLVNFNQFFENWDHPNTKPPLITILQALSFKTLGYNELALRLPVAISVLLMLFFLVYFSWKQFQNPTIGILASLVLVTSSGFITHHIARTGDHDAVLAFWILLVFVYFYKTLTQTEKQNRYIWLVALFMAAAVLTKSAAGLFPLPAMLLFALYEKKLIKLVKNWQTWGAMALFLVLISSFYLYRAWKTPGFLQDVWFQDFGGRLTGENHGHNHPWYYYINLLYKHDFIPWLFLIPFSVAILFTKSGKKYRRFGLYLLFCSISILAIISFSSTKCEWYHASIFPLLALHVALGINWLFERIKRMTKKEPKVVSWLITASLVLIIYFIPYRDIVSKVAYPEKGWTEEQFGEYMKKMDPGLSYSVVPWDRNLCVMFYTEVAQNVGNRDIYFKTPRDEFETGEMVLCSKRSPWYKERFSYETVDTFKDMVLIKITGKLD
ncbi:MAG: glycosyltransferase family 39 protein [Bacteroidales bacterium]|nr:glycosyltransferase family 39 protein [Bacteroidales bacterium]